MFDKSRRHSKSTFTPIEAVDLSQLEIAFTPRDSSPVREYGHRCLKHQGCLLLFLGQHMNGSFSELPITWAKWDTLHIPKDAEQKLVISFSTHHPIIGGPYDVVSQGVSPDKKTSIHLETDLGQIHDPYVPLQFYFPYQSKQSESTIDPYGSCIRIQVSLKGGKSPESVIATGVFSFVDTCYKKSQNDPYNQRVCTHGTSIVPLVSAHTTACIGSIEISHLLILPYFTTERAHTLPKQLPSVYWKSLSTTRVVGHRGLGANNSSPIPQLGENTILSFVTAASLGAEYVEFDVQMTKDHVPVIYHDFCMCEFGEHSPPVSCVPLSEFLKTRVNPRRRSIGAASDTYIREKGPKSSSLESPQERQKLHNGCCKKYPPNLIREPLTTLEEALVRVPVHLGFNIELKYPTVTERKELGIDAVHDMNLFCDAILDCLYHHVAQRSIIISSFNPQICILLALKQPHFPVFFLSAGGTEQSSDIRCNSISGAISFAKDFDLFGLVVEASALLSDIDQVQSIKGNGLVLLTYGEANNQIENVQLQKKLGIDAVIVDNVARIRRGLSSMGGQTDSMLAPVFQRSDSSSTYTTIRWQKKDI